MNVPHIKKRSLLFLVIAVFVAYFGLRLYAQYRPINIYVSRKAPMPAELAEGLHIEKHKISPVVTVESPYESAPDKILTEAEIKRLRRIVAWSRGMPPFIDTLVIESPTRVVARRETSRVFAEYHLAKRDKRWILQGSTTSSRPSAASE